MLNSIDEAIDGKYLVTKYEKNQADVGSMIHIMDAREDSDGVIIVDYRLPATGQNYCARFDNINQFYKWARPDTFIARYYENFSQKEIQNYIKVSNRTFTTFCLPFIAVALVVVWIFALAVIGGSGGIVAGAILSVVAFVAVMIIFNKQKSGVKLKMYHKVSASNWGIDF